MGKIQVVNVKCGGCANTVKTELEKLWITSIEVGFTDKDSVENRTISFDWDYDLVKEKLTSLWYPEVGSKEAKSILKKMRSFVSCYSWKMDL